MNAEQLNKMSKVLGFTPSLFPIITRDVTIPSNGIMIGTDKWYAIIDIRNSDLYLHDIKVLPEYRRKGIGKEAISDIMEIARDYGCNKVYGEMGWTDKKDKTPISSLKKFYLSVGAKLKGKIFNIQL